MIVSVQDKQLVLTAIDDVADRLIALMRDTRDLATRVPSTPEWTVADALAHVVTVAPRYCQGIRHEGEWVSPDELSELNRRQLAPLATCDVAELSTRLRATLAELAGLLDGFGEVPPTFRFHGGGELRADVALGILLGELVVHGWDIARALGAPWPIDPSHVELIQQGLTPVLPGWLDARTAHGHNGAYEIRLRGQGTHRFLFRDGHLTMNPVGPWRADVVVSADPVTFLLIVYKRRSQWPAILTGKTIAWGRRPWLALRFGGRFHRP